jgi:hypothetical protein
MKIKIISYSGITSTAYAYDYIRVRQMSYENMYGEWIRGEQDRKVIKNISSASMKRFYNYTRKINGYPAMDNQKIIKTDDFRVYRRMFKRVINDIYS